MRIASAGKWAFYYVLIGLIAGPEISRLMHMEVKEAMTSPAETIPSAMGLDEIQRVFTQRKLRTFPLVNEKEELCGVLSLADVDRALKRKQSGKSAGEIGTQKPVSVSEKENLFSALSKITSGDYAILPVVGAGDLGRLVGVIGRRDIMSTLGKAVERRGQA